MNSIKNRFIKIIKYKLMIDPHSKGDLCLYTENYIYPDAIEPYKIINL